MAATCHIRWMLHRDMPQVLAIEADSFEWPWGEADFLQQLRDRYTIGMVAEDGKRVLGYMVYDLLPKHVTLIDFAVLPEARREGVGRAMIAKLITKLSRQRRTKIVLHCRERNVAGQLFFRSQGFRAVNVLREFYDDSDEDAIRFVYAVRQHSEATT